VTDFLQTLVNGLAIGTLYALIALGYTMVYGILKFINFAHSDVFVVGAWISLIVAGSVFGLTATSGVPPIWTGGLILIIAMLACAVLALTIERLAYRPLRHAPRLNVLITAIGVSLFLQNTGQLPFIFGTQPRRMPALISSEPLFSVSGVHITTVDLVAAGTAIGLMLALEWLIHRTRFGRAMRAVSFDTRLASLMGINVDIVISLTFALGAALAAAAGLLYAVKYPVLNQPAFTTWVLLGLKAFVAAVVGGIGNVRGAMLGGVLIGLIEQFGAYYLPPEFKDVYVFSLLIIVLLLRPSGILGVKMAEKV